ncbi:ATP-dependent protease ATPase subunit HslU [Schlesneria paludicola]|uniref:ATP-dependent protease ATPase subunit HslU n=1 Tax=Schlesneria paludicola TaxID=360056 RepID=UPI00029AC77A|nr:ATP-dependent protease ATPase subunit HslU [Schlesneria paludicola]
MRNMTPRQIVAELDQHIVGQDKAKRAVAIALRNRWRWQQLPEDDRREITPKNIIMIGPTGVGKTEITRRLAKLIGSPFVKVEATRFTEVGYVGRDVESMIRELVDAAINLVKQKRRGEVETDAVKNVEERLLDLLVPHEPRPIPIEGTADAQEADDHEARHARTREKFRQMLRSGALDERQVELTIAQRKMPMQVFSNMGLEQMDTDFQQMFERLIPKQTKDRKVTVKEAKRILLEQETEALLDKDAIHDEALQLAESSGIVFLDEIDKICTSGEGGRGSTDVSRQGVQRDLLPIVEGATVNTRYGSLKTDHILFIAAGAFHSSRPADLMPELQGRFPIRVELDELTRFDFLRILTEPSASITRQYQQLLGVDGMQITFTEEGLEEIAEVAWRVNQSTQNIGARRLHTIMERLLERLSFEGPDSTVTSIEIDRPFVKRQLEEISRDEDLSKFIL